MNCPNCSTQNPQDAKFCMNCGYELVQNCPNCGTQNPLQANFCTNCGYAFNQDLPASNGARDQQVLAPQIPAEVAQKLIAARDSSAMVGERRIVTMLFCDVKGSTNLAEQLDPEEWTGIMNQAFDHLIQPIYRYEGTLARLMGDGLLAFFGAPIAHEDDPARAVLSGLAILEGIRPFCEEIRSKRNMDFDVRVGIHTGSVVVGKVGSDLAVEYTAMGDAVNLASRMEQTASPGTVQISDATYQLVKDLFEIEPIGGIMVKGKSSPVQTYVVLGEKTTSSASLQQTANTYPIIGRNQELITLTEVLDSTFNGRGNIVTISGEAGVGKTRLLHELGSLWDGKDADHDSWLTYRGLSYDKDLPYALFRRQLREQFKIDGSHSSGQIVSNLKSRGFRNHENTVLEDLAPILQNLLGGDTETDLSHMDPETFQREVYSRAYHFLETNLTSRPLALVVEDLQWADTASLALIKHFLNLANQYPILFIFTFRPDRGSKAWEFNQVLENEYPHRITRCELGALPSELSHELVSQLLDNGSIDHELSSFLIEKSEGNPLYLEAITATLRENGWIVFDKEREIWMRDATMDRFALPSSLQSLMTSQIDSLEAGAKTTLQVAAVIGRTFQRSILQELAEANGKLDSHLNDLQRLNVIQETMQTPDAEYTFRHEIMRDAAYRTILRVQRAEYHVRVGEALERIHHDRLNEEAHRIALHYSRAGEDQRALHYYKLAADHAYDLYAVGEAAALYQRAIEIGAKDLKLPHEELVHLFERCGRAMELNGDYEDVERLYSDMEFIAGIREDTRLKLAAVLAKATIYSTPTEKFDVTLGEEYFQRAISLAEELKDDHALAKASWLAMNHTVFSDGDPTLALKYGERSLQLARQYELEEQLAYTLQDIHRIYFVAGDPEKGKGYLEESRELWRNLGNKAMLADNLGNAASREFYAGNYDHAIAFADEGLAISEEIGNLWGQSFSRFFPGIIYLDRGQISHGLDALNRSVELAEPAGFALGKTLALGGLAWGYGSIGAYDPALQLIDQVIELVGEGYMAGFGADLTGLAAGLKFRTGHQEIGRALLEKADTLLEADQKSIYGNFFGFTVDTKIRLALEDQDYVSVIDLADNWISNNSLVGHRVFIADALYHKALAYLAQDQLKQAGATIELAREEAARLTGRRILWKIMMAQSELLHREGNAKGATLAQQEARTHLEFIISNIDEPAIKQGFQELPEVKKMFEMTP